MIKTYKLSMIVGYSIDDTIKRESIIYTILSDYDINRIKADALKIATESLTIDLTNAVSIIVNDIDTVELNPIFGKVINRCGKKLIDISTGNNFLIYTRKSDAHIFKPDKNIKNGKDIVYGTIGRTNFKVNGYGD